jgi:hypothetical protein
LDILQTNIDPVLVERTVDVEISVLSWLAM